MKKTNINYPYPVLNSLNEDYIDSSFDIDLPVNPYIEGDLAKVKITYRLKSNGIQRLINDDQASAIVYLESVESEYRKIFYFSKNSTSLDLEINKNALSKKLQIKGYIIAIAKISPFKLPEHNFDLFGNVPFSLSKGDIIAIADGYTVPLENYDPLVDRPSIFSIRKQTERPNDEISVDWFDRNKITIFLNEDTFTKYKMLYQASDVRSLLASMFAVPVLVDVLWYIKKAGNEELESLKELKWYQVINAKVKELYLDLDKEDSMTKIANIILPHVFNSNIELFTDVFKNLLPNEDD